MTLRLLALIMLVAVLPAPASAAVQQSGLDVAVSRLRAGNYEEAIRALRSLADGADAPVQAKKAYAMALLEVGRYEDVPRVVMGDGGSAVHPNLENVLGESYRATGRLDEAQRAFRRAVDQRSSDSHVARLNLGVLLWDRGERDEALEIFDTFIDLYNGSASRLSAEELMAVGEAVRYLGVTNPALYQDALMAFDEAAARDPSDPLPDILAGELLLEKYRATDARDSFRPVLEQNPRHPRALLGQARILDFEGVGGSVELVRQALEVNPNYADARTFLAELLLKTESYADARAEAREALATNPVHLGALSALAASHFLEGDAQAYEEVRSQVHALNPSYAPLYITMAEAAVAQRRYGQAVELAATAVELDPSSWKGFGVMGMNQLRTGEVEEGRANLERAFQGDPYNPWYKNSLDLLDTFVRYEEITTDHFRIFLNQEESELLGPYAATLAEESFAALRERYGSVPPTPIRLEIYPSHADFSVRTLGLTGLGALGVSFGSTLVMDSPSAQDPGNFNWASTLWHEVSHAFHLAMSDHRVPRWFTEGLAVHEQHLARPRWGHTASPAWLQAYASGRLHPVSRLNEGFVRPEYPQQVVFSYYQASLVLELIESRWGREAVLAMLDGYGQGKPNSQVFREVLGESPQSFDEIFDSYVRDRWGDRMEAVSAHSREAHGSLALPGASSVEAARRAAAENPGSFHARLLLGHALFQEERYEEAEVELRGALDLFPEYGGPDGPYLYLSRIHRERGELGRAARALQQMGRLNETLPEVHAEEAEIWMELGEKAEAARALEKVVEIVPFQVQPHQELASLYEELEDFAGAVRERRAILALDPTDRAEAHYRLSLALMRSGDRGAARSQVLRALELAPSYEEALDLLLELRGGAGGGMGPSVGENGHEISGAPDWNGKMGDEKVKKMMKGWTG